MKPSALLLAGALACGHAPGARIEMTADEQRLCAEQGGCELVTARYLRAIAEHAYAEGRAGCAAPGSKT